MCTISAQDPAQLRFQVGPNSLVTLLENELGLNMNVLRTGSWL